MRDVQYVVDEPSAEYSVSINGVWPRFFNSLQNLLGFMAAELTMQEILFANRCDSLKDVSHV